jgi:2-dehydro-3-deoxyphosphogluconate aldolase / (4S)-4-hydroxy-2-oxoglutarate aldolase
MMAAKDNAMPLDPTPLLGKTPVIPVLTIGDAAQAVPLARALVSGGLAVLEVTLRTAAALAAIKAIADAVPDAVVGAGTVTNVADIGKAVAAGARFLVSPGTTAALADAFAAAPVAALPGCATVSEAMALVERGFEVLKFFPAEPSGGLAWLKAVAEPLPRIRFCPTGGVSIANAAAYLALPNVVAVGGSWVAPRSMIGAGKFDRIAGLAREASALRK